MEDILQEVLQGLQELTSQPLLEAAVLAVDQILVVIHPHLHLVHHQQATELHSLEVQLPHPVLVAALQDQTVSVVPVLLHLNSMVPHLPMVLEGLLLLHRNMEHHQAQHLEDLDLPINI